MAAQTLFQVAREAEHRFWPKVDKRGPDECWPWIGGASRRGYGTLSIGSRSDGTSSKARAHRLSWALANGRDIPDGLFVLHDCPGGDNPPCVNPRHLFLGSHVENMADMVAKGRSPSNHGEANPRALLTSYAARIVYRMAVSGKWRQREIAAGFRISKEQVSSIKNGRRWAHATADIRGVA